MTKLEINQILSFLNIIKKNIFAMIIIEFDKHNEKKREFGMIIFEYNKKKRYDYFS